MPKQPLIVLIGDSLLMEGVAFSLASRPQLFVLKLEPALIQVKDCLRCLEPDLVIFETGAPWTDSLMSVLKEQTGIRLAGLDLDTCRVVVLAGHEYFTETMQDLLQLIQLQAARTKEVDL